MKINHFIQRIIFLFFICVFVVFHSNATNNCNIYTLQKGDFSVSVSAEGGKIISLQRDRKEMLVQKDIHPKYYGAVLWASPQQDYWPPSPSLDSEQYNVIEIPNGLRMISRQDTLTGLQFIKEFTITPDTALSIHYSIKNISNNIIKVAPWDVTRVHGGITFFPVKNDSIPGLRNDLEFVTKENGANWYHFKQQQHERGQKLFATTSGGWLGHLYGNLLLIKTFPEIEINDLPPLQGEVEIFLAPNGLYIELENHGKYTVLQPQESLSYNQKWLLEIVGNGLLMKEKLVKFVTWKLENK